MKTRFVLIGILFTLAGMFTANANQADLITPDFHSVRRTYDPKHTPKIEAPDVVEAGEWFEVKVSIGQGAEHPSLVEHHIQWIALYKDDVEISRITLHPVHSKPEVTFTIALERSATLKVLEQPNHTAPWEAKKRIRVVPLKK